LAAFAKNIKEGNIIYWAQGLCPNHEKSLALGGRGLEGLDRANCPSANSNDRILKPVSASLRAKMVYCNIRDVCIRDGVNCLPATPEEAKRLAEVIGVIAELAHQKKDKIHLSELRWEIDQDDADSEDQESEIVGAHNHLCK
jgi:hypothetical protein